MLLQSVVSVERTRHIPRLPSVCSGELTSIGDRGGAKPRKRMTCLGTRAGVEVPHREWPDFSSPFPSMLCRYWATIYNTISIVASIGDSDCSRRGATASWWRQAFAATYGYTSRREGSRAPRRSTSPTSAISRWIGGSSERARHHHCNIATPSEVDGKRRSHASPALSNPSDK